MAKAKAQPTFLKYGIKWKVGVSPLAIEFYCIRNHAAWGLNLFQHYVNAQALLWPNLQHHRWSNLILKTILEERVTIVTGPKDTGKTHVALARFGLTDYFAYPNNTLILVSSTELRGLETRIWGELKMMFSQAKERWPWLPGKVVDHMHGLFTDDLGENCDVRDIRKGILCVPCVGGSGEWVGIEKFCFAAGTQVDTPTGPKSIETLAVGDLVLSAIGPARISETSNHLVEQLCRVSLRDGRSILCTPNHKFFTQHGWISACNLNEQHYMLSVNETMRIMQGRLFTEKEDTEILRQLLCAEMDAPESREKQEVVQFQSKVVDLSGRTKVHSFGKHENGQSDAQSENLFEGSSLNSSFRGTSFSERRERNGADQIGMATHAHVPRGYLELSSENREEGRKRIPNFLQGGHWISCNPTGNRSRWKNTQQSNTQGAGRKKGYPACGAWVESIAILEQNDSGFQKSDSDCGRCRVFNLEVEGHPSFNAEGLVAHNCGIKQERRRLLADELQFMKSPYLTSVEHLDKGDFKMVGCNNPIGMGDPADKMSEPIEGWGTEPQSDKTETWRNKWGGVTINLDGRDSPNNDEPKNSYSYLINEDDIQRTLKRCGPDSSAFWTQVIGKRKVGLLEHRVLTYAMCKTFKAFDDVIWKGVEGRFKVYGIDASYGGDRCVGGWAEVGQDINDVWVVSFNEPVLIPIKMSELEKKIAEDQIAEFVRKDCEQNMILPENVFFDATGRGSLGTSFGRLWSAMVNPVEFGGTPTPRPVAGDMFILDPKTKQRRLKRCDEHYSKRVTEYWFSVRYLVESGQCRNMPKEVAEEFGMREWYPVKGDRKELEIKEETKTRMGCSPDLADWACIVVEGARRRGFSIKHGEIILNKKADTWKNDLKKRMEKIRSRYELNYSA